jgi:hypothetical protein
MKSQEKHTHGQSANKKEEMQIENSITVSFPNMRLTKILKVNSAPDGKLSPLING